MTACLLADLTHPQGSWPALWFLMIALAFWSLEAARSYQICRISWLRYLRLLTRMTRASGIGPEGAGKRTAPNALALALALQQPLLTSFRGRTAYVPSATLDATLASQAVFPGSIFGLEGFFIPNNPIEADSLVALKGSVVGYVDAEVLRGAMAMDGHLKRALKRNYHKRIMDGIREHVPLLRYFYQLHRPADLF